MNANLSKLLVAMTLSAGLMAAAHADVTQPVYLAPVGTTTTESGVFTDTLGSAGTFTDDYVFNGAPPVSLMQFLASASSSLSFTNVSLSYAFGGDQVSLTSSSLTPTSLSASFANAGSGLYDLQISGIALVAGASYSGSITEAVGATTSPVPEPHSWALMLTGLAATGLSLRKRRTE